MPVATPEVHEDMLDRAKAGGFAYPTVEATSSQTLLAALRGFAEAGSDGIVQVSARAAAAWSGFSVADPAVGAAGFAEYARVVARSFPVDVALHTGACNEHTIDTFLRPLLELSMDRVGRGEPPLFNSHAWDGSALAREDDLTIADGLLERSVAGRTVLELHLRGHGGRDGGAGSYDECLSSAPADALAVADRLGVGGRGRYVVAVGPGHQEALDLGLLPPDTSVLAEVQHAVGTRTGRPSPLYLALPGGSDRSMAAHRVLEHGVVRVTVDVGYAFTRPIVDHVFRNDDRALGIDGGPADGSAHDPSVYARAGEQSMAARVVQACEQLRSIDSHVR